MANPEHLGILKQGTEVWNEWRGRHPEVVPDISFADLKGLQLSTINLSHTNLSSSALSGAMLLIANLAAANLTSARLQGAYLTRANLTGAILTNANMTNTSLHIANLTDTDLTGAILNGAVFLNTELRGTKFNNTKLGNTIFADIEFGEALGLDSVEHWGPSFISIDTIYRSKGYIPEIFLRGCGVPDEFITYMNSLTGQVSEFYNCFISFTESDNAFSERLYNDLQGSGVRCWRWKEDAKWGKTLMRSIDEAVRVYDKLIVICSKQSLNSPAVIREIELALQKEDDLARHDKESEVLFPIRLDDYIFTGWNHHRKADVVAKNVGDFRYWHEPEQYKKAFDRLLRDLKAEEK